MSEPNTNTRTRTRFLTPFLAIVLPVFVAAAVFYRLDPFEPVHIPLDKVNLSTLTAPLRNDRMRIGSEDIAKGEVVGPEDLVYDAATGVVYTGCADGWVKRVTVNESVVDSVVEEWINTGGRPLGLALEKTGELIVADADKGLLRVTREKKIELLVDEVEGLKFKITDGVDVAHDGTIYFTDASHKYSVKDSVLDILEGKPNGRFLSYNPSTKETTVLLRDLYFPNGVVVSPDQNSVVFCETVMMNCKKYYIQGPKKGSTEKFCDLPGMPDNIHYDGHGQYWIGIATAISPELNILLKYPFIRKVLAIITKQVPSFSFTKNGGVIAVDLEGKQITHYYDSKLSLTSGIRIRNHIYCGSLSYPFIIRLDIEKHPALSTI
ncbi:protein STRICTOSIDINE SYNTHASE-LIKE 7-like [Vicia villosa]|uniref:protein STRICTOSIDINE SYNTHASE-LIKE 7-like n=1 Tax=Vicia villosa TaxID=3911 RepID=UPI00273AAD09|nr:protein STRICTOSIDINE SYNTHASE-LIKE 7-like [Vicia villosa]